MPFSLREFRPYARRFLKVKHREGGRVVPLILRRAQEMVVEAVERARVERRPARIQVLKARRMGISTICGGLFFHEIATSTHKRGMVLAHRGPDAEKIFGIYERFYQYLPEDAGGVPIRPKRDGGRGKRISFRGLDSEVEVESAASCDLGRGGDCQLAHLSEVAFFPDPVATLTPLMAQVPATGDTAVILESTAKGPNNFWHELWLDSNDGKSGWDPIFCPWFLEPEHRLDQAVPKEDWSKNEREMVERLSLDGQQLAWYRFKLQTECFGREDLMHREYPATAEEAFCAVGDPAWHTDALLKCFMRRPVKWCGVVGRDGSKRISEGPLQVWEDPEPRASYVIGVDCGAGLESSDLNVASIWKVGRKHGEWPVQVAEMSCREDMYTWAESLNFLGHYYNKALLSVEVTGGIGRGTQLALQKHLFYPFLHRWVPFDRYRTKSDTWGWETSWKSKQVMLGICDWLIRTQHMHFSSPALFHEFTGYQNVGGDQFEGVFGDDRVMASMIAFVSWFQHIFPGVPMTEIRSMLAKIHGGASPSEPIVGNVAMMSEAPPPESDELEKAKDYYAMRVRSMRRQELAAVEADNDW